VVVTLGGDSAGEELEAYIRNRIYRIRVLVNIKTEGKEEAKDDSQFSGKNSLMSEKAEREVD
jgi:hypothetical protein